MNTIIIIISILILFIILIAIYLRIGSCAVDLERIADALEDRNNFDYYGKPKKDDFLLDGNEIENMMKENKK